MKLAHRSVLKQTFTYFSLLGDVPEIPQQVLHTHYSYLQLQPHKKNPATWGMPNRTYHLVKYIFLCCSNNIFVIRNVTANRGFLFLYIYNFVHETKRLLTRRAGLRQSTLNLYFLLSCLLAWIRSVTFLLLMSVCFYSFLIVHNLTKTDPNFFPRNLQIV